MVKFSFLSFVYNQLFTRIDLPHQDLTGKVVIVTGSNIGLGFENAKHLAAMKPAKLILACRDLSKANKAIKQIKDDVHAPETSIEAWHLDLQNFDVVKKFADRCLKELDRLDILIENAGIATKDYKSTSDGWESTIQTNVLSTFLLAMLLLPLVRKTTAVNDHPRIIIVASEVHHWSPFVERTAPNIFERLNDKSHFKSEDRYQVSKLLDVLLTRALSDHMTAPEDKKISIMSVNPGLCHSELAREMNDWFFYLFKKALARTTEYGARTFTTCAVGKIPSGRSKGTYWTDGKEEEPSDFVISSEGKKAQDQLWEELKQILRSIDSRAVENVE